MTRSGAAAQGAEVSTATELCAIIAGGRARRLDGRPKGLIPVDGRPNIDRLAALLAPRATETVLIADPHGPYATARHPIIPDALPHRGAPGGVLTALRHARAHGHTWIWTLACDLPRLDAPTLEALVPHRPGHRAALYRAAGHLQPLAACWHVTALPAFEAALHDAAPGFAPLLAQLDPLILDAPDPTRFADIDTPADARALGLHLPTDASWPNE